MKVYVLDIRSLSGREAELLPLLPPERRERVLRLRFALPRLRSLGAGLLLGCYVGPGPFSANGRGKPFFPGGREFNLSHGGHLAALAVDAAPVGVDVEPIAPVRPLVLRRVLSPEEQRWMEEDPERRFAVLWTRKEALLKREGTGIDRDLRKLRVLPGREDSALCPLFTTELDGHVLSVAGGAGDGLAPRRVTVEELLSKEA